MLKSTYFWSCFSLLALSSAACANESVYQKFSFTKEELAKQCKDLDPPESDEEREARDNDPSGHAGDYLCSGYKAYKVHRNVYWYTSVQFGYLSDRFVNGDDDNQGYLETFATYNAHGDKIEWRLDDKGIPRAAILRYTFDGYEMKDGQSVRVTHPDVLVISKVGQPDSPIGCAIGLVDTSANSNANEIARQVADEVEPGFKCLRDKPKYFGKLSKDNPGDMAVEYPPRNVGD